VGLRSSTTADKAFQHLKAKLEITKSVFKIKMVGENFWNFWCGFSMFCEKLQNVCPAAANPDQTDKNGYDVWTQLPPEPPNPLQTSRPQKSCRPILVLFLNYDLLVESARKKWMLYRQFMKSINISDIKQNFENWGSTKTDWWSRKGKAFCERPLHCIVRNLKRISKFRRYPSWKSSVNAHVANW